MTASDVEAQAVQEPYAGTVRSEPSAMKNHLIAFLGEFFGTFVFLWTAFVIAQMPTRTQLFQLLVLTQVN